MNILQVSLTRFVADGAHCTPYVLFALVLCLLILAGNKIFAQTHDVDFSAVDQHLTFIPVSAVDGLAGDKKPVIFPAGEQLSLGVIIHDPISAKVDAIPRKVSFEKHFNTAIERPLRCQMVCYKRSPAGGQLYALVP